MDEFSIIINGVRYDAVDEYIYNIVKDELLS
jgi:hypothetical protein